MNVIEPVRCAPDVFSKKYDPIRLPNFCNDPNAKEFLSSIVDSLRQDPVLDQTITAWHRQQQTTLGVVDMLAKELSVGTCYGEGMAILELLDNRDRSSITDDWLYQKLTLEASVRYQILHYLHGFIKKGAASSAKSTEAAIAKKFPSYMKKTVSSEIMKFRRFKKEDFVGRLSDFIRQDIRGNNQEGKEHDYSIFVTFRNDSRLGHAAIIYYSEAYKHYFWYDSFTNCGLYSTGDRRNFLKGIAEKILDKRQIHMDRCWFTAYELQQGSLQDKKSDAEIDSDTCHIDKCGYKGC